MYLKLNFWLFTEETEKWLNRKHCQSEENETKEKNFHNTRYLFTIFSVWAKFKIGVKDT